MSATYVKLTGSSNPVQQSLIEEILKGEGIPFEVREAAWLNTILGPTNPLGTREFFVPSDKLQEAKDILCGHSVVCDVSERMLKRSMDEIVRPLLQKRRESGPTEEQSLERLAYFAGINNKETVNALFDATLKEEGGEALLEDLFFDLAQDDSGALRILARHLREADAARFGGRFNTTMTLVPNEVRIRLLDVLSEFPPSRWRLTALLGGLRDGDADVRAAAGEALFSIRHGEDCGYDPDAPEEEREQVIERLLRLPW